MEIINFEKILTINKKLPNVWEEGIIFAYSGIDGKTSWKHPFVASTLSSYGGLLFHTSPERELFFTGGKLKNNQKDIIASDFVFFSKPFLSFLFINRNTLIGQCNVSIMPEVSSAKGIEKIKIENSILQSAHSNYTALVWERKTNKIKFAYSFDNKNIKNALNKAKKGLKIDFFSEMGKKLAFYKNLPKIKFSNPIMERAYYKAFSVLKVNTESPQGKIKYIWTTPDRFPHRDMWLWDSAFHILGNKYISTTLAESTIKSVLSLQRKDGFIPHQMNPEKGRVSNITHPPTLAWASYKIYQQTKNKKFLRYVYPKLKKYIHYLYKNRDRDKDGLLEWEINSLLTCKCGESGMDNSPRFDKLNSKDIMAAIDFNSFAVNEMDYLTKIAHRLGNKNDATFWEKESKIKKHLINSYLWDKKNGFYYDLKENREFNKIKTVASFLPLFAGIANKEQAKFLVKHLQSKEEFWSDFPIPSVSTDEPSYCKDMWRGPTWINYNYLIIEGLEKYGYSKIANQIARKTLKEIAKWYKKKGVIFEYYDNEGKTSPDNLLRKEWLGDKKYLGVIKDYNWSASIYIAISHKIFSKLGKNKK